MKCSRPKVYLIDAVPNMDSVLSSRGYNVSGGSFGSPYEVPRSGKFTQVLNTSRLNNYLEHDVIIIDFAAPQSVRLTGNHVAPPTEEEGYWGRSTIGLLDPRPIAVSLASRNFNKIYENGGVFIVFFDPCPVQEVVLGRMSSFHRELVVDDRFNVQSWAFLDVCRGLWTSDDAGNEVMPKGNHGAISQLIADHLNDVRYSCTFPGWERNGDRWLPLLCNKYGEVVSGMICPPEESKHGWVFLLPRIKDQPGFVSSMLKDILPDLSPSLFPNTEGQKWVHMPQYELPTVLNKIREIEHVEAEAADRVAKLKLGIDEERRDREFMYTLIRGTGSELVDAVKKALSLIGFMHIVDVDEELRSEGKDADLREDIRILDATPALVVDVKGVNGSPSDAEALQAAKHAFMRINETRDPNFKPLTIINHQRLLPPLDRSNEMPFRKEILGSAEQQNLGLMTCWDLFRLIRGLEANGWRSEHLKPLFYKVGRIDPRPMNYEFTGEIQHVWKEAFSLSIVEGQIRVGDKIALEFPVDFSEQWVSSMQLNNQSAEVATARVVVGIGRDGSLPQVKEGMRVYRVT